MPRIASLDYRPRKIRGFLLVSLALHAAILLLWQTSPAGHTTPPALTVKLMPSPITATTTPSPSPSSQPANPASASHRIDRSQPVASDAVVAAPLPVPIAAPTTPRISLDNAFATARAIARTAPPTAGTGQAKSALTVEAAVARATQRPELIETRGATGEYITIDGNTRCVTPLQVPHYMSGMPVPTQCEVRKG